MRSGWMAAAVGLALVATAAVGQPVGMINNAYSAQATARMKAPLSGTDLFDAKALRVVLCGTSAPFPDPARAKSCTAVIVKGRAYIVDAGSGAVNTLQLMGFPMERIGAVFLTHYHSDHIADLGEMKMQSWVAGRSVRLPVYGPPGVETVVAGFNTAYALDDGYRNVHHGEPLLPIAVAPLTANAFPMPDGPVVVYHDADVTVTAFPVKHDPIKPAVGYRFDAGGRSVVISGDTAPTPSLAAASKGADLLVGEALSPRMMDDLHKAALAADNPRMAKIFNDVQNYHSSPVDVARAANEAGVKLLVYTHLAPALPQPVLEKLFFDGVAEVRDPKTWAVGFDGLRIDLPFDGSAPVTGKVPMLGRP